MTFDLDLDLDLDLGLTIKDLQYVKNNKSAKTQSGTPQINMEGYRVKELEGGGLESTPPSPNNVGLRVGACSLHLGWVVYH